MTKEQLLKHVCETFNAELKSSYEAIALYPVDGMHFVHGYIVNDEYFINKDSFKIYLVKDLSQIGNMDTYEWD